MNQPSYRGGFTPSADAIAAAETLFVTMAMRALIEPVVINYQRQILAEHRWPVAKKWTSTRLGDTGPILEPNQSYLLEEEDFQTYLSCCYRARDKAMLVGNHSESCPLLEIQELERQTQHWLIRSMESSSPLNLERATALPTADYKRFIDIVLELLAPYVDPRKRYGPPPKAGLIATAET